MVTRFIAGAICPECRALDRIVIEDAGSGRRRRCVQCGYSDDQIEGAGAVPPARFSRRADPAGSGAPVPQQAVRIVDPRKPGS